jgi:hypothetical protein
VANLSGEQIVALVTLLTSSVGGGAALLWRSFIKPRDQRLSDIEQAQAEAREARAAFQEFVLSRITMAEKERDASNTRAETAIASMAVLTGTVNDLSSTMRQSGTSLTEEVRKANATLDAILRDAGRARS